MNDCKLPAKFSLRNALVGGMLIAGVSLAGCGAPGSAKTQQMENRVPPMGALPALPSGVTAKPSPKKTQKAVPPPPPAPAPAAPPAVTVTKEKPPSRPPAPRRPAPAPAPAPAPKPNNDSEIRIQLPPDLKRLL